MKNRLKEFINLILIFLIIMIIFILYYFMISKKNDDIELSDKNFIHPAAKKVRIKKLFDVHYMNFVLANADLKDFLLNKDIISLNKIQDIYEIYENPCFLGKISNNDVNWKIIFNILSYWKGKLLSIHIEKDIEKKIMKINLSIFNKNNNLSKNGKTIDKSLRDNPFNLQKVQMGIYYLLKMNEINFYSAVDINDIRRMSKLPKISIMQEDIKIDDILEKTEIIYYRDRKFSEVHIYLKNRYKIKGDYLIIASYGNILLIINKNKIKMDASKIILYISKMALYRFLNSLILLPHLQYEYICTDILQ